MRMINTTDHRIANDDLGIDLAPGESAEVVDGYCLPSRTAGGARLAPTVERLCPGLVPEDSSIRDAWHKAPAVAPAVRKGTRARTVPEFVALGHALGIANILAKREDARFREVPSVDSIEGAGHDHAVALRMHAREVAAARDHSKPYTEGERDAHADGGFVGYGEDGRPETDVQRRARAMGDPPPRPTQEEIQREIQRRVREMTAPDVVAKAHAAEAAKARAAEAAKPADEAADKADEAAKAADAKAARAADKAAALAAKASKAGR